MTALTRSKVRLTKAVEGNLERFHTLELIGHGVAIVLTVGLGYLAIRGVLTADSKWCDAQRDVPTWNGVGLAAVTLLGFVCGRLIGEVRSRIRDANGVEPPVTPSLWLQTAFAAFLLLSAALLGYETWSMGHSGGVPPITTYVRCAALFGNSIPAAVATFQIGVMVGNWLWYPTR